eukprot:872390-Rhodomonas_salina.2
MPPKVEKHCNWSLKRGATLVFPGNGSGGRGDPFGAGFGGWVEDADFRLRLRGVRLRAEAGCSRGGVCCAGGLGWLWSSMQLDVKDPEREGRERMSSGVGGLSVGPGAVRVGEGSLSLVAA